MSEDGFDITELTKFSQDLLNMANDKLPKESRKFIKRQGAALNKINLSTYNSMGIGEGGKKGLEAKEAKQQFRSGKVYKYGGSLSVRAFNSSLVFNKSGKAYSFGGMMNNGFVHVNRDGSETFVPGYHFMEKAQAAFEPQYATNAEEFIGTIIDQL